MGKGTRACLTIALIAVLALASCAGAPGTVNSVATEKWLRLQTEHFDLSTDLPEPDARRAAEALERTRAALLSAAWAKDVGGRLTARTEIVVFRNGLDYEHFVGRHLLGHYTTIGRPTLFLWGPPERWERGGSLYEDATTSVLRHELVHRLAAGLYAREPRWFSEGLAQFLETMVVSEDGKSAILGRQNFVALRRYKSVAHASVADALAWRTNSGKDDGTVSRLYGVSWLMVHFLYYTRPDAFAAYQVELAKGTDPAKAWTQCFGDLRPDVMDVQLREYSLHGKFNEVPVALAPVTVGSIVRKPITEADVYALRAQVALSGAGLDTVDRTKEGRAEIDRALALEQGNVLALRLLARSGTKVSNDDLLVRLRKQVAARPDDAEAWLLLGEVLMRDAANAEECIAAMRRAAALSPGDATAYNALAWVLVATHHGDEALPLATKAAMLSPWNPDILDTYAAALFEVGRCPDALRTQRRAVDMVAEQDESARDDHDYEAKLAQYTRACGDTTP